MPRSTHTSPAGVGNAARATALGALLTLGAWRAEPVRAQGWEQIVIPILIHGSHSVSNVQQRKAAKKRWLTVAAQEAEDLLRSQLFREIIRFVRENRDLFEDVYERMREGILDADALGRVAAVLESHRQFGALAAETALLIDEAPFTAEDVAVIQRTAGNIVDAATRDADLLREVLGGQTGAHLTDADRLDLLELVDEQITRHRDALIELNGYARYVGLQRTLAADDVTPGLFTRP